VKGDLLSADGKTAWAGQFAIRAKLNAFIPGDAPAEKHIISVPCKLLSSLTKFDFMFSFNLQFDIAERYLVITRLTVAVRPYCIGLGYGFI
jgi:hypothetical protein